MWQKINEFIKDCWQKLKKQQYGQLIGSMAIQTDYDGPELGSTGDAVFDQTMR